MLWLTKDECDRLREALEYAIARRTVEDQARFQNDHRSIQYDAWRDILAKWEAHEPHGTS